MYFSLLLLPYVYTWEREPNIKYGSAEKLLRFSTFQTTLALKATPLIINCKGSSNDLLRNVGYFHLRFIFALNIFLRQLRSQTLDAISWRKIMTIWIHLLSRQPFSRYLVSQKRNRCLIEYSVLGNELTWKGLMRK